MKLVTTLQNIKEHNPNRAILNDLLEKMGQDIDNPNLETEVSLRFIFNSLGLDVALYLSNCFTELNNSIKWFSLWCAERVRHLMKDEKSTNALDVARRYLEGKATRDELKAAWSEAMEAWSEAMEASDACSDREEMSARDVAWAVQSILFHFLFFISWSDMAWVVSRAADAAAAAAAAAAADAETWGRTWDSMRKKQTQEFIRLLDCIENGIEYSI